MKYARAAFGLRSLAAAAFLASALSLAAAAPLPPPLPGDLPLEEAPETYKARKAYFDSFIMAGRDKALAFKGPAVWSDELGRKVRVSLVAEKEAFYAVMEPERAGGYSRYGQGSWIIKRDMASGQFVQAKLFLRSDPGVFARFAPLGNPETGRSSMEVVIYGAVLARGIILPLSFFSLLQAPLSRIRELSAGSFDWSLLSPEPALYVDSEAMVRAIRAALPTLAYGDDGAVDGQGLNVRIATGEPLDGKGRLVLNCSGFAKWIVDGLRMASASGSLLSLEEAKRKWPGFRGSGVTAPYEDSRDPYFGLDWVRNLALAAAPPLLGAGADPDPTLRDVRMDPFPMVTGYGEILNADMPYEHYPDWLPEAGFRGRGIKAILYLLALREPGNFYLASVNKYLRGSPSLRQHTHVAALFPYFASDGVFRVAVFESAEETGIDALQARTADDYLFLVRLRSEARPDLVAASGQLMPSGAASGLDESAFSVRR